MAERLDLAAFLGLALLAAGVVTAAVIRLRRGRGARRLAPARAWWIAPSAVTVTFATSTVVLAARDPEVGLFWTLYWIVLMPLVWGSALALRLLWYFLRPILLREAGGRPRVKREDLTEPP